MLTGKLELLEIAEATANFRKSIEPYSPAEGTACRPREAYQETPQNFATLPSRFEAGCDALARLASGKSWQYARLTLKN
jgi:hypothetical protein